MLEKENASMYGLFPRSMGNPHQNFIARDSNERNEYIRRYIKLTDVYISVYAFTQMDENNEPIRDSAIIDKVFFDFDSDQWLQDLWKIHDWCKKYNILHRCHYSGNGGHAYIFVRRDVVNKKEAIGNFQRWIIKQLGVNPDPKIIGDIARITRYVNTYNFKGKRFCIPIPEEALDRRYPIEWYYKHATTQQLNFNAWSGSNLLSLKRWDSDELLYVEYMPIEINLSEIDPNIATDYKEFPPCVQQWLSTPDISDEGKFLIVLFLKDQTAVPPFDSTEIISILKKCLSKGEFEHYFGNSKGNLKRRHAGHRGVKFKVAMIKDYYMPDCYELQQKGYCPANCGRRHPIYS